MAAITFTIEARSTTSQARAGVLVTPYGAVETPVFMPVGTQAAVKSVSPDELERVGADLILANAYHLYLRPGPELIRKLGGLHRFMGWPKPILTDSGGFQVFSLGFGLEHGVGKIAPMFPAEGPTRPGAQKPRLTRVDDEGVTFTSHIDGSTHRLTPEKSIQIQEALGADIILAFDECTSPLAGFEYTRQALQRTHRWAERSLNARTSTEQGLFGIVQGGEYRELREESAAFIARLPFDGYAIGGSLGKSKEDMLHVLEWTVPLLPDHRPRHLLGIGEPEDLLDGVARGMDMFDCVTPTRLARHGGLLTADGRMTIANAAYRLDPAPVEAECDCYTCRTFSRAYLHHLFAARELLAYRLATIHNLRFMFRLTTALRRSIATDTFADFRSAFLARYLAKETDEA